MGDEQPETASNSTVGKDPLGGLSHGPVVDRPGYYVQSGPSPYTVAFVSPGRRFLSKKGRDESVNAFLKRTSPSREQIRALALQGLPIEIPHQAHGRGVQRLLSGAVRRVTIKRAMERHPVKKKGV